MRKHVFNTSDLPWETNHTGKTKKLIGSEFTNSGSLRLMSIEPDQEFKTHEHDFLQLMYFKNGEGIISVDDQTYEIVPGLTVIVLPHQCHSVFNSGKEDLEIIVFEAYDLNNNENPFVDY